jgi:hypothetical protein
MQKDKTILLLVVIFILFIIAFLINNFTSKTIESFDDFSPYENNLSYPFLEEKKLDNILLKKKLKIWENPFNKHDEGYYNAEPYGEPPLTPIYSYTD